MKNQSNQNKKHIYLIIEKILNKEIKDIQIFRGLNCPTIFTTEEFDDLKSEMDRIHNRYKEEKLKEIFDYFQNFYFSWDEKSKMIVDDYIYTKLNIIIILSAVNQYALSNNELRGKIIFNPCGFEQGGNSRFQSNRFKDIYLNYTNNDSISFPFFKILGEFLSQIRLNEADLKGIDCNGYFINMEKANLIDADLRESRLSGIRLSKAYLNSVNLSQATLKGADLSEANLNGALLEETDLSCLSKEKNLEKKTNLTKAYLGGAFCQGIQLQNADLTEAILCGVNFTNANLTGAIFRKANLMGSNLTGAILENTVLEEADLTGVTLKDIRNYSVEQWKTVKGLQNVCQMPEDLKQQLKLND